MKVIPAIDLIGGKCVRLTEGDYTSKKEYSSNPLEIAQQFEEVGFEFLHLVDLDGAKEKKIVNWTVLEQICKHTKLKVDFGGGVQSDEDIKRIFEIGASQVTIGSLAVKKSELFQKWLEEYGSEKIILAADVKNENIAISGWLEQTSLSIYDLLRRFEKIKYVLCTDISRDGKLNGTAISLYNKILQQFPHISLIASGGIGSIEDVEDLIPTNVYATVVGKAIYEEKISLTNLIKYNK